MIFVLAPDELNRLFIRADSRVVDIFSLPAGCLPQSVGFYFIFMRTVQHKLPGLVKNRASQQTGSNLLTVFLDFLG